MKPELKTCRARNAQEWRRWLEKHHDSSPGVWLVFYRASTQKPCVSYEEALDDALCFGWIDSIIKRIDDECYVRKFTPRTNPKKWSALNLAHMRRLIADGKATEAGLRVLGVSIGEAKARPENRRCELTPPEAMLTAIARNAKAAEFWEHLAPGFRRRYTGWVLNAKHEETRLRRIGEVVGFLAEGKKSLLK